MNEAATLRYLAASLVLLLSIVVFGTVLPFLAELSALQYLSATEVGLVAMLEPVGAMPVIVEDDVLISRCASPPRGWC